MQANSRVTDAWVIPPAAVPGAFPSLVGESIQGLLNRYHNVSEMMLPIGTKVRMTNGDAFVYGQFTGGAAVLGQLVHPMADTSDNTVSSSADLQSIETVTGLTANAHVCDLAWIDDGTGEGQMRWIIGNTTTAIRLDRPLTTALAVANSAVTIIRPYRFKVMALNTDGTQGLPSAVAVGAVTQNYYGWFQCDGIAAILSTATTIGAGAYVTGDDSAAGTAGCMKEMATGFENLVFGYTLGDSTAVTANTTTVPVRIISGKMLA